METLRNKKEGEQKLNAEEMEIEIQPLTEPKTLLIRTIVMQERLAISLTIMVGFVATITLIAVAMSSNNAEQIKNIAAMIIPQLLVLYGTIIGFYFGTRRK